MNKNEENSDKYLKSILNNLAKDIYTAIQASHPGDESLYHNLKEILGAYIVAPALYLSKALHINDQPKCVTNVFKKLLDDIAILQEGQIKILRHTVFDELKR